MTSNIFTACIIVALELFVAATCQGGNHHLCFKQHHVVQQVVAPVYPLYFAGQATQDEALLRKAIRAEAPAIIQGVLQQLRTDAPQQQTAAPQGSVFAAKCLRCHSGESAKGAVRLDGFIDAATRWRITELLSGHDVPDAMKGVIGGLQPGDHPAILQELMNQKPAKPPESPPTPADPFDAPGVLR